MDRSGSARTTIVALDLSLTATGVVVLQEALPEDRLRRPLIVRDRYTIKPKGKRQKDGISESTPSWNRQRYLEFATALQKILNGFTIDAVVTEVTEHAYHVQGGKKSSKGIEYRAGYGLGRAAGWLDAVMASHSTIPYHQITASLAKLRVCGASGANKGAVKDGLETYFGYAFVTPHGLGDNPWTEAEIDALAVGVGWWRETFEGVDRDTRQQYLTLEREVAQSGQIDRTRLMEPIGKTPRMSQRPLPDM